MTTEIRGTGAGALRHNLKAMSGPGRACRLAANRFDQNFRASRIRRKAGGTTVIIGAGSARGAGGFGPLSMTPCAATNSLSAVGLSIGTIVFASRYSSGRAIFSQVKPAHSQAY